MKTFLDKPTVRIVAGPHAGREGNVVSIPWLGNLWHWWMVVNIPLGPECRGWITVYRSQVEFT